MAGHIITQYFEELNKYEVFNSSIEKFNEKTIILDVFNQDQVRDVLSKIKPDVVINCIGILVQASAEDPAKAIYLNAYLPHFLSEFGAKIGFKLIHMSTDCVFSGKKGSYNESDIKDGTGYYAQTKSLGEILNNRDLTFRMSIIGPEIIAKGTGLFHWFMNQKDHAVDGYSKAFWTGVTTLELAKGMNRAIEQNLTGLYHFIPSEKISKYNLLQIINEIWKCNIIIKPKEEHIIDKSLINTRTDFNFQIGTYRSMLLELKEWVMNHRNLYSQYF